MEGDAGTRQLNPTDADAAPEESLAVSTEVDPAEAAEPAEETPETVDERRPSHLGVGWLATICAALVLLAAGVGVAGYFALRSNDEAKAIASSDDAAMAAAKDCVAATHAPDTAAMTAAQTKIVECSTGDFAVQASLYSSVLVDAYQAANVKVAVSDMRAAVERHNTDGSVDVLVAVRVKVTNSEVADQEQGYRLRVKMALADGTYKIADLEQVTS
jgi:Mce-associated membrane protein